MYLGDVIVPWFLNLGQAKQIVCRKMKKLRQRNQDIVVDIDCISAFDSLKDKKLIIRKDEADIVKEIFRLFTEDGQSIKYITKKLNDENISREQRGNVKISGFTERTVRGILKNPVYAGMIAYGRRHTVKMSYIINHSKINKSLSKVIIILFFAISGL